MDIQELTDAIKDLQINQQRILERLDRLEPTEGNIQIDGDGDGDDDDDAIIFNLTVTIFFRTIT